MRQYREANSVYWGLAPLPLFFFFLREYIKGDKWCKPGGGFFVDLEAKAKKSG